MNTLYIMVGLSASLKSTMAEALAKFHNADLVSSDSIRAELSFYEDQSRNEEVFKIFHKRIRDGLNAGNSVIADATNITLRSRKQIIDIAKRIPNVEIVGIVMTIPWLGCIARDCGREHEVGTDVIVKQLRKFEMPFFEEGFDDIVFVKTMPSCYETTGDIANYLTLMSNFNQENPYHQHDLLTHSFLVAKEFQQTYPKYGIGALYHDLGKLTTKKKDDDGIAHYYNHENVGAYDFFTTLMYDKDYDDKLTTRDIIDNTFLINYHMRPFNWKEVKTVKKYTDIFGEDKTEMLIYFNELDQKY